MGNVDSSQKGQHFSNGMSSYKSGYYREAVEHLEKAVNCAKLEEGSLKSHNGITCLAWLGLSLFMAGEHEKAMEVFDKCNTLEEQGFGITSDYAQTLAIIGHALVQAGQHQRALSVYEHCKALHSQLGTCETPAYATLLTHFGVALIKSGYNARACTLLKQSLEAKDKIGGGGTKDYAVTMAHLATAYDNSGEFEMAVQIYEKVQMLYVRLKLSGTETHAVVLNALGAELIKVHEYKRATVVLEQAKSILEKLGMRSSLEYSDILKNLEDAQQKALNPPQESTVKPPRNVSAQEKDEDFALELPRNSSPAFSSSSSLTTEDVALELPRTSSSSSTASSSSSSRRPTEDKERGTDDEEARKKRHDKAAKKEAKKKSKERAKEHAERMDREVAERKWRLQAAKEDAERKAAEEAEKQGLSEEAKRERATKAPSQPSPAVSPRYQSPSASSEGEKTGQLVSLFDAPAAPNAVAPSTSSILNWLDLPPVQMPSSVKHLFSSSSSSLSLPGGGGNPTSLVSGSAAPIMEVPVPGLRALTFRLKPEQDIYESIQGFVEEHQVEAGCILSAVGSITQGKLRFAGRSEFNDLSGSPSWEIVSMTGTVSIHGSHIHAAFSDQNGQTLGGHLVAGCKVYTTCEVVILHLANVIYRRQKLPNDSGYEELVVEEKK